MTTPSAKLKVSDRARLALEASPYSERQIRRRESRARAKAHAGTQPRGVVLGTEPSTSKAPVVAPDDVSRETEDFVAAADRVATPRAPGPATSTPKPSPRVARQSPEAHARRLKAAADELLRTPLPRVESVSPVGGFDVESDVSHVSPSPPRRARFGDPTPASTPAGRAAMALIRSRASAAWQTPGTDGLGDRARDEDAGVSGGTPVGRAAAARDRLRRRREAMAERFAAAERAYSAFNKTSSSVHTSARGKARRARTSERRAEGGRETKRDAERTDADEAHADGKVDPDAPAEPPATPATPAWSTSYGGGSASARRAARLAAMTPHREPREFREFRALREKNAAPAPAPGPGPGPAPAAPVPSARRLVPSPSATKDASTTHRVVREPPSCSKDEALAALRETMARRKRERRARREATLKERAKLAAKAPAMCASPRTPTGARLSDLSFERARAAYGTDPKPRPAPVPVTARPLVAVRKTPEPPVLPTSSEKKRRRERRDAAVVAAAASPYSASPRVALRRSRFVPAASPADALPTLVAFRPRPPDRGPTEPGDDGPDGIVVLPSRPRRPTRPARPARRGAATSSAAAEAALPPALGRDDVETRMPKPRRRAASEDETRDARRATEAVQREREKEKVSAVALERTARRLREAAERRARVREARRDKARTLTPGKPKPGMDVFPNLVASRTTRVGGFSLPFPRLGSHALGSHLPARARDRSRAKGAVSKSPFAPAAAATSRRRDRATRAARDAVDDVVDRLVLDVVTAARRDDARTVRAERAERRRVREGRRTADEIYAQNLAKKTAEAHRLARRAEKRAAKPTRTRPSPSRPTKPKPSRVDGVVRLRVDASARRELAAKRRERRRLIEARRAADFARLTLAREKTLLSSSSPLETTPSKTIEKAKKEKAPSRALSSFELELARFPRGVSAFDWEAEALPLGAAAASARAASAFAGVSALKSTRKRRTSASTRDATARRARRREVEAEIERRAEKETNAVARTPSDDFEAVNGEIRVTDPIDPEALAAAADALRAVEAAAFATLASFAEVDEAVHALIEREAHIEAVAARAARGAAAKAARETALAEARAEAAAEAAREAALAEALRAAAEAARARRKSAAERIAAYIIDTVLVNETVRVAEELHLARRVAELRERHEALRKRLEWRDRLEHTPRAVLRRSLFTSEEEAIIRLIEPALAIRTVKDARYDPFANGPDLSWAVTDEERARRAAAEARGDASAAEAPGLASAPSAKYAGGAFGWDPAPIAVGAAAASRRAAAAYGGASRREMRSRRRSRARERLVAALVRDAIGRVVGRDASSSAFESAIASEKRSESAATNPLRAVAPDAIDLELDWSSKTSREKHSKSTRGVSFIHAALLPDAAAEMASSGSEPEDDFRARLVAKPANFISLKNGTRTAFKKPRAGARPPSPVSPLTPSGVVISPLSISLRGVRKSLA